MTFNYGRIVFLLIFFRVSFSKNLPEKSSVNGGYKSRISGGHIAAIEDHRHHVQLLPNYCGGSIIGTRYILSAWVCDHPDIKVRAGTDLLKETGKWTRPYYTVKNTDRAYLTQGRGSYEYFDTMLVTLNEELIFGDKIFSVPLGNVQSLIKDGRIGTIAGFGITDTYSNMSQYLRAVEIPIFTHETCVARYSIYSQYFKEHTNNLLEICGGYDWSNVSAIGGHHSFCWGDLGSGIIIDGFLAGVAVRDYGCGQKNDPGIFETIWYLSTWLFDKIHHTHCVRYKDRYFYSRNAKPECKYEVMSNERT